MHNMASKRHQGYLMCAAADTLVGKMTVREMLIYTAEMKNLVSMPKAENLAKVRLLLQAMHTTFINALFHALCTIAVEQCSRILVGNPDCLRQSMCSPAFP